MSVGIGPSSTSVVPIGVPFSSSRSTPVKFVSPPFVEQYDVMPAKPPTPASEETFTMCPRPRMQHPGKDLPAELDRRHEVHLVDRADVLRLRVDERADHVEPRVVHEHVDRAGVALDARDRPSTCAGSREVGRERRAADVGHHLAEQLGVARDARRHGRPLRRSVCDRLADAA